MVHFEVDPDSLTAAAEVARRQRGHVAGVSGYIDSTCSRFDAFSGVLKIFEGSYRETVHNAQQGMASSRTVADKVGEAFRACRDDYLESDRSSHTVFRKLFGDEMALPPYEAPGSGATVPGGPSCPAGQKPPDDDEPFGLAKLPPWMSKPLDRVVPGDPSTLPPWMHPQQAAQDGVLGYLRDKRTEQLYLHYRAEGMTPAEALSHAHSNVDSVADGINYDQMGRRADAAYDDAYDRAIADGRSPDEARDLARDAASDQFSADAADRHQRHEVLSTAGTYKGAYDEVASTVDNVQDIVKGAEQLHETTDDLGDYDDYEGTPEDRSAQDWANR